MADRRVSDADTSAQSTESAGDARGTRGAKTSGVTESARILRYQEQYEADYAYEAQLVAGRQLVSSDLIHERRPSRVVEIGCGKELLSARVLRGRSRVRRWVVVEPSPRFARVVDALAQGDARVQLVEGFFEAEVPAVQAALGGWADLVIIDGLLHELGDPLAVLRGAREVLAPDGCLHVSVPNARSLHRRVAKSMKLISSLDALSERNHALEQARVYDRDTLRELLNEADFEVVRWGGHTIKPFTNDQMSAIEPTLGAEVLEGLMKLGAELPDLAAEIWMDARRQR